MSYFQELTLIFLFTFLISLIFRILKQPLIISYIFAGIILSKLFFELIGQQTLIQTLSELGITFLLFLVGLELRLKNLREIGIPYLIIGVLQEVFTIFLGFLLAKYVLGLSFVTSLYLAIAFSFSSTIIVLKILSDKGDLEKLYGKLTIGFMIVQDLIAILILFLLPFLKTGIESLEKENFLNIILGISFLFLIPLIFQIIFRYLENFLEKSQEFLFLFSVTFGLGVASLFKFLGFGLEAGALIAGVSLSGLSLSYEVASKLRPLRDFFLILFFIFIGSQMFLTDFSKMIQPSLIFSLFVLIANPLIMMLTLYPLNYSSQTNFLLSLTSGQISEFSFILVNQGVKLGHLSPEFISLTGLVGLISIFFSTYFLTYADRIYLFLKPLFRIFERKKIREEKERMKIYEYFLFGCDRIGHSLLSFFENKKDKLLIIDYNPETVKKLKNEGFEVFYGDTEEIEFLEELNFSQAKMVISTIPNYFVNLLLIKEVKKQNEKAILINTSHKIKDALDLYQKGADFVIMPYFLGGDYTFHLIKEYGFNKEKFQELKIKELGKLEKRKLMGHKHPKL